MKTSRSGRLYPMAFTLVEMLIVIAIIGILAALLIPALNNVRITQARKAAYAEMNSLQTAIENYHAKFNFYPPDNPTNPTSKVFWFELKGTILGTNAAYTTLDGTDSVLENQVMQQMGVGGFVNSATSLKGDDNRPAPHNFISKASRFTHEWNYRSTFPTNNPGRYDLWVDIVLGDDTNRINNWSQTPQILK